MGALTDPVWFREVRVTSGDVIAFVPVGPLRWLRRPFAAVVDTRDRSVPYLVFERRRRVVKVPLDGSPFHARRYAATVYRLPGIDKRRAAEVAACAAERPGEGIHHPDYDCGRTVDRPGDVVRLAYAAIGEEIDVTDGRPGAPLAEVRGPQDPPNEVIVADEAGGATTGDAWISRGIPKTLPWQQRSRRD